MVPTMTKRSFEYWDHLCDDDLYHSNIRRVGSLQFLDEFQERLGRKRYLTEDVRAVLRCCRPPDFRWAHISRSSPHP